MRITSVLSVPDATHCWRQVWYEGRRLWQIGSGVPVEYRRRHSAPPDLPTEVGRVRVRAPSSASGVRSDSVVRLFTANPPHSDFGGQDATRQLACRVKSCIQNSQIMINQ